MRTVKDECYESNQPETIQELKYEIKIADEIRAHTGGKCTEKLG